MEHSHTHTFYGMGSHIKLWLEHADEQFAQEILAEAEAIFVQHEKIMTRFRSSSELSQLNARPEQWVQLSDTLWTVINRTIQLATQLDGLFDPTILEALEEVGYRQPFMEGATYNDRWESLSLPTEEVASFTAVKFDPRQQAVWLPQGVRLDLGGIGKGFTAETAVNFLRQYGPCLVDAGGDLTAGNPPTDAPGWPVGISAPYIGLDERPTLLRLWLANNSLATSGVDYRRWQQNGIVQHHIIDPRLNNSAETDLATVSVLAEDACMAEAWATAVLVAGFTTGYKMATQQQMPIAFIDQNHELTVSPTLFPHVQFTDLSWI